MNIDNMGRRVMYGEVLIWKSRDLTSHYCPERFISIREASRIVNIRRI